MMAWKKKKSVVMGQVAWGGWGTIDFEKYEI